METAEIERILVPLDGSELAEQAIPVAAALAAGGAEIALYQVVARVETERDLLGHVEHEGTEVAQGGKELSRQDLERIAQRWRAILPETLRYEVGVGEPPAAIVSAARQLSCDLIVAASHGRGAVGRWVFGSVADALIRTATVPVLIVRPRGNAGEVAVPRYGRIIVPYDGSELAAGAFPLAISLAKRLQASILLLRAIAPTAVPPLVTPMEPYYPAMVYDEMRDDLEADAAASLERTARELAQRGVPVSHRIVQGTPFDAVSEVARNEDLIVMTSHGRSGFERWLLGSVAEKLVRDGPVPVAIVPAPGRAERQPEPS